VRTAVSYATSIMRHPHFARGLDDIRAGNRSPITSPMSIVRTSAVDCLVRLRRDQCRSSLVGGSTPRPSDFFETAADRAQNNRTLTGDEAKGFEEWENSVSNEKPMSKQERWALRELMTNPDIRAYCATLTGPQRRRLNHPNAIVNHWKKHRGKKPNAPRR